MNRRGFLTLLAQLSAASLVVAIPTSVPLAQEKGNDKALGSHESAAGRQLAARLGPDCQVLETTQEGGQLLARVGFQGHDFYLRSKDGQVWRTAGSSKA